MVGKKPIRRIAAIALAAAASSAVLCGGETFSSCPRIERPPAIDPDYSGTVVPPNIAPMNFMIREDASRYRVHIFTEAGDTIRVTANGPSAKVVIPQAQWRTLLRANRGRTLTIAVYEKRGGRWSPYHPIVNRIAGDTVDGWLVYRKILGYKSIPDMEIRQRSLAGFDDRTVLDNRTLSTKSMACINCHSFRNNAPDDMIIHLRGEGQGMLLASGNRVQKIDTRTEFNKGPASYSSWHPSGELIAFATMKVNQTLHSTGEPRVVLDEASDLIIYNVATNTMSTHPSIADPGRMETLPEWSPDGRFLYFCSAPGPEKADDSFYTNLGYREIKYDIMRVSFDMTADAWGVPETLVSSRQNGLSNVQPKISPDGRFLLFVTMPWSYFAVYSDESDLWMMDLATRAPRSCRRLDNVNSTSTESFHSWSSNGRWFVFNSRRRDGICGLPYFAFVDTAGSVSKPFLLPQRDPAFYETWLKSFNVPVLVSGPVRAGWRKLGRAVDDQAAGKAVRLDPRVPLEGMTGASARVMTGAYVP
ncbi:MAG: PD40 domain-containing protein [Chitinispirillaceae bacterium]|nr:PD40 domain-containing protein [Chitinispirillaceae bacterium]